MPLTETGPDSKIEYLSILNEDGELDKELAPQFTDDLLLKGYRTMLLARRFDERRLKLQRSGRIGTFAPVNGQEAAQVGTISALREDDWFVPSYRETAANFWRGTNPADMLVFDAGYNEGIVIPEGARNLPNSVPVGTQMLQAAGIAYAARLEGTGEVAMTYFGDGATSQGDFHEALNFASVFDCPVVFVCQNNQYAISVPRARQTRSQTLAQKALAYGMDGIQVDGNDIFACFAAADDAVRRARETFRPTLIECVTYRLEMHTTADDPSRYRDEEEVEWEKRDPIERFGSLLRERGLLDDGSLEDMEAKIAETIDAAWDEAEKRIEKAEGVSAIFDHILEQETHEQVRQKQQMSDGLGGVSGYG
ncbi:pyruvate dehydrogenase (acetyl-transferring) E1 component subunit alpha [Roseibium salinum]|uniref:pyruvate dehydrogenase (acetyl-transferring) E1 component subunit alpha n=1 Tax=Roseibium salinum TaxID=1604349 RepID=UPI00361F3D8A